MTPESLTIPGHEPDTLESAQQVLPPERSDRIRVAFDDHRLVTGAGLTPPVTLAPNLGWLSSLSATLTWEMRRIGGRQGDRLLGDLYRQCRRGVQSFRVVPARSGTLIIS